MRQRTDILRKTYLFLKINLIIVMTGISFSPQVEAQNISSHIADLITDQGSAGLGFITRYEKSPYIGEGYRQDLLPLYLYEGEYFSVNADHVSFKFIEDERSKFEILITRRREGFVKDDIPKALKGMKPREGNAEIGLEYQYNRQFGTLYAGTLHDISNTTNGNEYHIGYYRDWRFGNLTVRPDVTISYRDANLNNYYYGVREDEVAKNRPAYNVGSGINTTAGIYGSYPIFDNWRLLGGVGATWQDKKVRNSPIVEDSINPAVFLGAVYDFGSHKTAWDEPSEVLVKVFYGQASAKGCHLVRIMSLQCASFNHDKPTNITGVHFGKNFIKGLHNLPIDFNGYAGVLYRNDEPYNKNGYQIDLYMKGLFYGFPWNHIVETRLGMGYGVSYAERVPFTEIKGQKNRGRPNSRLLNYLDPSIDVNLGDIFRSQRLKKTYFGVGVSHRSGIFGSSRLLGSVNGGSNYIYGYIESSFGGSPNR